MPSSEASSDHENIENTRTQLKNLRNTIDHLEAVSIVPSKQRHTSVTELVGDIASDAYDIGIPSDALEQLIDVLTKPNNLDQATTTTLIKNLYAQERVSSIIVTKVIGGLGPGKTKPSLATQALLVRWLLLVYECLEDQSYLSKLYSVLFNLLDMISLRRPLCHLLSLITRRRHVKPFRIQAVMELLRNAGDDEKELTGLLRVFKNYYPDIIVGEVGRLKFFFKHPDPEWTAKLKQIQHRTRERSQFMTGSSTFQVVRRGGFKRSKVETIIPEIQTSRVPANHTSLEELRNVDDFVQRFDQIELPNQIISVLDDRLAQKYMAIVGPDIAKDRLEDWLEVFLKDEADRARLPDHNEPQVLQYILEAVSGYAQRTKQLPHAIQTFLKSYLRTWDGQTSREEILNILQFLPKGPFDELKRDYLGWLDTALIDHTASSRTSLLDFYANLIRKWGIDLRAESPPSSADGFQPLIALITHAEFLLLSLMELPPSPIDHNVKGKNPVVTSILDIYANLAELYSYAAANGNIRLTVPLAPAVYILALTSNLGQISRICSILATYKNSFEASLTSKTLQSPVKSVGGFYAPEMVGLFNGYVMDLCNLIWRNRALNNEDQNSLGCLIPKVAKDALDEYINDSNEILKRRRGRLEGPAFNHSLGLMFSLSHHVALASHSAACFAAFEDQDITRESQLRLRKPVTQKNLTAHEKDGGAKLSWQEYRVRMLDWFEELGSEGIGRLMRSTMKALRKEA
ncbi:Mis6 domain protein [Talaromyces proteolyticus]|uniref:Mis6 domain protein n=1 Tax=Talaromyces proteolyticus TaxID=1131652 RepID=A0AAD4KME8_9EURO|nr:Mis6 domain protein [Talaromyces proteolyticus]KAH8695101.1 Mis6 domain protein [Talaromyces proteolyticus]